MVLKKIVIEMIKVTFSDEKLEWRNNEIKFIVNKSDITLLLRKRQETGILSNESK